jgi:hypothetical protein
MPFTLLGDEFSDDTDLAALSDAAVRTHIDALVWSSSRLLDLEIPKKDLARFAFSEDRAGAVAELVKAGWWIDLGDRWRVVHRAIWQWTKAQHEQRQLVNRRAQKHRRGDHSLCLAGKCSHALSADVSAADNQADVSADLGEERQGQALKTAPPTEDEPGKTNVYGIGLCAGGCGSFEKLGDDGLCSACFVKDNVG